MRKAPERARSLGDLMVMMTENVKAMGLKALVQKMEPAMELWKAIEKVQKKELWKVQWRGTNWEI